MHVGCNDLPFGGAGASGIGYYHGKEGFKTFSNIRSVLIQSKVNVTKLIGTILETVTCLLEFLKEMARKKNIKNAN